MQQNNLRNAERGNVFLFILMGVVLFAALAFIISRSMRSDTTTAMSSRQAELAAVDILGYAQRVQRAVSKIQTRGISENDISFENDVVAGYTLTPAAEPKQMVFNTAGGGVSWQNPPSKANDGSPWLFSGRNCVVDIGTGAAGCSGNTTDDEELILILPNLHKGVCEALDNKLGISGGIPTSGGYNTVKYTGAFSDGMEIDTGAKYNAACWQEGANYHFYYVLIAR